MGVERLRYSVHAGARLVAYSIDEDDVEAIVWYPARRYVTRRGVEHDGWTWDGRPVRVVTDRSEQFITTIADTERRVRTRRNRT